MAETLQMVSVAAPGFFGLNKQASTVDLPPAWATEATNCVRDRTGRIAARKGWTQVTTSALAGSPNITFLGEYVNTAGASTILSAATTAIYSGTTSLTSIYSTGISNSLWQGTNFNNYFWLVQSGHDPLRYDGTTVVTVASLGGAGTMPQADCILSAFSRLWVANTSTNKTTVYWSDSLAGHVWSGGSSGSLDLYSVFNKGGDSVIALAEFNGYLIIFCRKQILVYSGASSPSSMSLSEQIIGVGCVARDSVVNIGTDLLFLSDNGVRSLARTLQTNTMPLTDVSRNIRDDVVADFQQESTTNNIKGVYHEPEGFYLITFPAAGRTYCFDIRAVLEDKTNPVFVWSGINPRAFLSARDKSLYLGKGGMIGKYSGYLDNTSTYIMTYATPWLDFGSPEVVKIVKKIKTNVAGTRNTSFTIQWSYDYASNVYQDTQTIPGGSVSEYNVAQYNIDEYTASVVVTEGAAMGKSSGKTVQLKILATVNGTQLAINRFVILAKVGRIL